MLPAPFHREMVFGRALRRLNLDLQTLAKVTLNDDGSVQGHQHLNEAFWEISGGTLSFASHQGITTRFDQHMRVGPCNILMGRCLVAGYDHFLYPYVPMAGTVRIQYLVSSHADYGQALESILPQLIAAGVPTDSIWVTVAGSSKTEMCDRGGIRFSHVPENAFEYTALIDAATREFGCDYFFLLHDTCHIGPKFRALVESQPATLPIDYVSVLTSGWFNIGLYSAKFLRESRELLKSFAGVSKKAAIEWEMNLRGKGFKRHAPLTSNFLTGTGRLTGIHRPYGDLQRRGIYLSGADLHKFYGIDHSIFRP